MTGGGVPEALKYAGTDASFDTAIHICRPGGVVGHVGVPAGGTVDLMDVHMRNIGLIGGVATARAYMPELPAGALIGRLDPSPVFDLTVDIEGIPGGYAAMDERRAIKVLVGTGAV